MSHIAPERSDAAEPAEVRLPIDFNGAIKALQFGAYGAAGGALLGVLALPAASVGFSVAAPVMATLGLGALGYRLGRKPTAVKT